MSGRHASAEEGDSGPILGVVHKRLDVVLAGEVFLPVSGVGEQAALRGKVHERVGIFHEGNAVCLTENAFSA